MAASKPIIALYNGERIPVENTSLTAEEFGDVLAGEWPELKRRSVSVEDRGDAIYWTYAVRAGTKGL